MRPGRLEEHVTIHLPNEYQVRHSQFAYTSNYLCSKRKAILSHYIGKCIADKSWLVSDDAQHFEGTINEIAQRTEGKTCAELSQFVQEAAMTSLRGIYSKSKFDSRINGFEIYSLFLDTLLNANSDNSGLKT